MHQSDGAIRELVVQLLHCQLNCISFIFQNTVEGRIAYFPAVGRLDCDSSSADHRGFWQLDGYGLVGIYKSDWTKIGGKSNLVCLRT